jgi:hypothetical protein
MSDDRMTKKEAVRRALEQAGRDATPSRLRPILKERFGVEMNLNHIATTKRKINLEAAQAAPPSAATGAADRNGGGSQADKNGARGAKPVAGKKGSAEKARVTAPPAPTPRPAGGGFSLADIGEVRGLLARVGAETLMGLIDVLAK